MLIYDVSLNKGIYISYIKNNINEIYMKYFQEFYFDLLNIKVYKMNIIYLKKIHYIEALCSLNSI